MAALLALACAVVVAIPSPAIADSGARTVASIQLPHTFGAYRLASGGGSMWAIAVDFYTYGTLYRIDPVTDQVIATIPLGFPAGGLAFGAGSVWVTDYYGNAVVRLRPDGRVQATIPVGGQPVWTHVAFGSVWVSNHTGHSLTRIDPATNGVLATVQVGAKQFLDGPADFSHDARYLYVGTSDLTYVQRVDPTTERVRNLADVGHLVPGPYWTDGPLGGTLWNDLGSSLVGYDVLGVQRLRVPPDPHSEQFGLATLGGLLWFGERTRGAAGASVRGIDPVSGAQVSGIAVDVPVESLAAGFGRLWSADHRGDVRVLAVADPAPARG